mmetsp:Transcript_17249/g.38049  ORF Transcript_17249/g.38049 Transcript_17249/m.38049 type:complete len:253 (+) Transcript_17249:51-809(+)
MANPHCVHDAPPSPSPDRIDTLIFSEDEGSEMDNGFPTASTAQGVVVPNDEARLEVPVPPGREEVKTAVEVITETTGVGSPLQSWTFHDGSSWGSVPARGRQPAQMGGAVLCSSPRENPGLDATDELRDKVAQQLMNATNLGRPLVGVLCFLMLRLLFESQSGLTEEDKVDIERVRSKPVTSESLALSVINRNVSSFAAALVATCRSPNKFDKNTLDMLMEVSEEPSMWVLNACCAPLSDDEDCMLQDEFGR